MTTDSGIKVVGRNEPCPCGSGKKYKRCHGVDAAPKLTESKKPSFDPSALGDMGGMNPEFMMQVGQALQRLPKGQIQKLQHLMQKAMSGTDVSAEAAELEKSLPPDFKNMMQGWQAMAGAGGGETPNTPESPALPGGLLDSLSTPATIPALPSFTDTSAPTSGGMTEDEARRLVEEAAKEGKISEEQAQELLNTPSEDSTPAASGFGRLWRGLSGKKKL